MNTKHTRSPKGVENQASINISYDITKSVGVRFADFLGKYHISLNGVVVHEPFMLTYEGKPNDRCDTEHKQELVIFVERLVQEYQEKQRKGLVKGLKKIKKEIEYLDYGWSDLEDDLDALIKSGVSYRKLKTKEASYASSYAKAMGDKEGYGC